MPLRVYDYVKYNSLYNLSLPIFIGTHELLDVVNNSGSMNVLACVSEGVLPSDRRQPALRGASVDMVVRRHRELQAIFDGLCQQPWTSP